MAVVFFHHTFYYSSKGIQIAQSISSEGTEDLWTIGWDEKESHVIRVKLVHRSNGTWHTLDNCYVNVILPIKETFIRPFKPGVDGYIFLNETILNKSTFKNTNEKNKSITVSFVISYESYKNSIICPLKKNLSSDIKNYLKLIGDDGDVSFISKEGTTIKSHMFILKARSTTFHSMFNSGMIESKNMTVNFKEYPESLIRDFLHFLHYDQVIDMENNVCDLLILSDMYNVDKLKFHCETYLASQLNHKNAHIVLQMAVRVQSQLLIASLSKFYHRNGIDCSSCCNEN